MIVTCLKEDPALKCRQGEHNRESCICNAILGGNMVSWPWQ